VRIIDREDSTSLELSLFETTQDDQKPFFFFYKPINISGSKALNKKQNLVFKLKKLKPSEKWSHTPSSCGRSVPLSCVATHCYHTLFTLSFVQS
jgi:hypothetical protein